LILIMTDSETIARWGFNLTQTEEIDDWSSSWRDCQRNGIPWGGRKKGGRGIRATKGKTSGISVENVSVAFLGQELLSNTKLSFQPNRRYGLVGENGVGKSTLLRKIAQGSIPGFPIHHHVLFCQQELPVQDYQTTVEDYIGDKTYDDKLRVLFAEEQELEEYLVDERATEEDLIKANDRLYELAEEIAQLNRNAEESTLTLKVLEGLNIQNRLGTKVCELSGGWRMRVALARVLIHSDIADVILLDEATNHCEFDCQLIVIQLYLHLIEHS